ncbi:MAG: antiterminator LoaP [Saccharofermentanales bacterium]
MNWYAFNTDTRYELQSKKYLDERLNLPDAITFVPMREVLSRYPKQIIKRKTVLFSGYMFMKTELTDDEIFQLTKNIIHESKHIKKLLSTDDARHFALAEDDKNIINVLCNNDYCVEASKGIIVGDKVIITNGPLMQLEGNIRKIDRHKLRAIVAVDFMGLITEITLSLEIVEKILTR